MIRVQSCVIIGRCSGGESIRVQSCLIIGRCSGGELMLPAVQIGDNQKPDEWTIYAW
jgi:hypothetical protein